MTTYFCDGLKDVTIVNGVARLEFQRLEAVQNGSGHELRAVPELAVALPMQGLVLALEVLERVRDQLRREGAWTAPRESAQAELPRGKSPNFT